MDRTDTQSPALHVADGHDLIRVHGARVNNLKDISIDARTPLTPTWSRRVPEGRAHKDEPQPSCSTKA